MLAFGQISKIKNFGPSNLLTYYEYILFASFYVMNVFSFILDLLHLKSKFMGFNISNRMIKMLIVALTKNRL